MRLRNNPKRGGPIANASNDAGSANSELTSSSKQIYATAIENSFYFKPKNPLDSATEAEASKSDSADALRSR